MTTASTPIEVYTQYAYLDTSQEDHADTQLDNIEPKHLRAEAGHNDIPPLQWSILVLPPMTLKLCPLM